MTAPAHPENARPKPNTHQRPQNLPARQDFVIDNTTTPPHHTQPEVPPQLPACRLRQVFGRAAAALARKAGLRPHLFRPPQNCHSKFCATARGSTVHPAACRRGLCSNHPSAINTLALVRYRGFVMPPHCTTQAAACWRNCGDQTVLLQSPALCMSVVLQDHTAPTCMHAFVPRPTP